MAVKPPGEGGEWLGGRLAKKGRGVNRGRFLTTDEEGYW